MASAATVPTGRAETGRHPSLVGPGLMIGVGLGGFVDGILLHQVLQWHHMLSSTVNDNVGIATYPVDTVAGLEVNTLWDGLFHATAWIFVLVGLMWARRRWSQRRGEWLRASFVGLLLAGWGIFNLVEGVVDHHLLAVHHVRAGPGQLAYDLAFLALGAALVVGGLVLHRSGSR